MAQIFVENNISGKALLLLKKQDLVDMGIVLMGEMMQIKEVVKKLKEMDKKYKVYERVNDRKPKMLRNHLKEKVE